MKDFRNTSPGLALLVILFLGIQHIDGQPVLIRDPGLRVAIEESLDLRDRLMTIQDLENLEVLDASFRGVQDLSGLEHARNLVDLDLGGNDLQLFSLAGPLPKLERLNLAGNRLRGFSTSSLLPNLKTLHLEETGLPKGFRPFGVHLEEIASTLSTLFLSGNVFSDFTFLQPLTNLVTLDVGRNSLTNFALPG